MEESEYVEIEQDSGLTSTDMIYLIQDKLSEGFELVEFKIVDNVTTWVFRK